MKFKTHFDFNILGKIHDFIIDNKIFILTQCEKIYCHNDFILNGNSFIVCGNNLIVLVNKYEVLYLMIYDKITLKITKKYSYEGITSETRYPQLLYNNDYLYVKNSYDILVFDEDFSMLKTISLGKYSIFPIIVLLILVLVLVLIII
jgi:hypothetical protein